MIAALLANARHFNGHNCNGQDGAVNYVNRYVETSKLIQERATGKSEFPGLGQMVGIPGLFNLMIFRLRSKLGLVDASNGALIYCFCLPSRLYRAP